MTHCYRGTCGTVYRCKCFICSPPDIFGKQVEAARLEGAKAERARIVARLTAEVVNADRNHDPHTATILAAAIDIIREAGE